MAENKCRWQDRDGEWHNCHLDLTGDLEQYADFNDEHQCIFHAQEKEPKEFRSALARLIRRLRNDKADEWDFWGIVFADYELFSTVREPNLFLHARFQKDVDFSGSSFPDECVFKAARFLSEVDFSKASFGNRTLFDESTFLGTANFEGAIFKGYTGFADTSFGKYVSFVGVTFKWYALFDRAIFCDELSFREATFLKDVSFEEAVFTKVVELNQSSFSTIGDFYNCYIFDVSRWEWPGEGPMIDNDGKVIRRGKLKFHGLIVDKFSELDFRNNVLQDDCKLEFDRCDMSRVRLEGTECTQIRFYANKWGEYRGRTVVGDEYLARTRKRGEDEEPPRWDLIQITYQQLARRFREDLNHQLANEFDRGVFEMRREAAKVRGGLRGWSEFAWITAYKWVSHYSGSLLRTSLWWLGLVLGFAMIYSQLAGGNIEFVFNEYARAHMWNMLLLSLKSAISVAAADVSLVGIEPGIGVASLSAIQKLLSGVLLTLFIFTIRRRFKH